MRPKDLMIGDWVILRDPDTHKKTKVIVTWCDLGDYIILQCFEPIPITPEILEKNGFVKQAYGHFRYSSPTTKTIILALNPSRIFWKKESQKPQKSLASPGFKKRSNLFAHTSTSYNTH